MQCCPKVFSLLNVCVWLDSNKQTCRTLQHYWTLHHIKGILHGKVVKYGKKTIAISEAKYGYMWRCLPTTYPAKAVPPFSSSNNGLHSCRLLIAEKCGTNNWQEQSKAPLTVWYEIHTSAQPVQQPQHNLHAHSSVTLSHDITDDRHAWSTRRESITWNTIANQAQSAIWWVIDIFYI